MVNLVRRTLVAVIAVGLLTAGIAATPTAAAAAGATGAPVVAPNGALCDIDWCAY